MWALILRTGVDWVEFYTPTTERTYDEGNLQLVLNFLVGLRINLGGTRHGNTLISLQGLIFMYVNDKESGHLISFVLQALVRSTE